MKKILIFASIILFASCAKTADLAKLQTVKIGNDTSNYIVLTQAYLPIAEEKDTIQVYNSEDIKIEGVFCDIMSKDSLKCIPSTIKALTKGKITKIFKRVGNKAKRIVVSYSDINYEYSFSFEKKESTNGSVIYALDAKRINLLYKGKTYTISGNTVGDCILYIKE